MTRPPAFVGRTDPKLAPLRAAVPARVLGSSMYQWRVAVTATDIRVSRRLAECLVALSIPHQAVLADTVVRREQLGTVYCFGSAELVFLQRIPKYSVIVYSGETVAIPDRFLSEVADGGVAAVALRDLTPVSLLRAILIATQGPHLLDLREYLRSRPRLAAAPVDLVDAFLLSPSRLTRLCDICRALQLSRAAGRVLVREAGFRRAEHLLTVLKADAWVWFRDRRISRGAFEPYLGILSRSNFYRACLRAGIHPPWPRLGTPSTEPAGSPRTFGAHERPIGALETCSERLKAGSEATADPVESPRWDRA